MPIFEEPRMAHRLKLGFVFDGGQLLGQLTVAENIALPLRYHGACRRTRSKSRVRELLEVDGAARRGRTARRRMWAGAGSNAPDLARALALQPEVLLLDSPLTGLDVRHMAWWLGFLDELSRGHGIMGGKPVTLVVTADDLRPWRGTRRARGVFEQPAVDGAGRLARG